MQKLVQLFLEPLDVLELAIDRGKADVRDLVHPAKFLHDELADLAGGDLRFQAIVQRRFDPGDDRFERRERDGTLLAGGDQAVQDLLPVEGLSPAILFDDDQRRGFDALVGGETLVALLACSPAPDDRPFVGRPGLEYAAVGVAAKRAAQSGSPPVSIPAQGRLDAICGARHHYTPPDVGIQTGFRRSAAISAD